ncbi:MAG: hypothetical protein IKW06_05900 [Clostridia bacterium]|nr:hypothetical protein [Clostridia bacterium]
MTARKKAMLFMFVDYMVCLLLQLIGLLILSWMFRFSWGYVAYSIIFTLIFFGMIFSRAHNTAKHNLLHKDLTKTRAEGLLLASPLAIFNTLLILLFALIQANIIPLRDLIIDTVYSFPDNAPRIKTDVFLIDYITGFMRVWFGGLIGFMPEKTSPLVLLVSPASTLLAGFLGYFAGLKKFYLLDVLVTAKKKIVDKFNE